VGKDIYFQKGGGGGRFGAPQRLIRLNTDAGLLAAGDFDGDGRQDLFSVQKGTFQGWNRLLLNTGNGRFAIASYGRVWTAVDSVTVGNIDLDLQDEVLLEGRGPLVATTIPVFGEAPEELRVLDPLVTITAQPANILPGPYVRFVDLGVALYGYKLGVPMIANIAGGAINNIVVGGQDTDTTTGFVQVYAFAYQTPFIGNSNGSQLGIPPALFNPAGDRITVLGVVTSFGYGHMAGDSRRDLIVSSLELSVFTPIPFGAGVSNGPYTARTFALPRTGANGDVTFGAPVALETRQLTVGDLQSRVAAPEYRIATVSDLNSDGQNDVGISVVETFQWGLGSYSMTGNFVQVLSTDVLGQYFSSIVAQVTSHTVPASAIGNTQLFLASDIRRVGRPDLFVAEAPSSVSPSRVTIRYNVKATPIIPFEG
jgi:hypothetical protein